MTTTKIIILFVAFSLLLAGCALLPKSPVNEVPGEQSAPETQTGPQAATPFSTPTASVEQVIEQAAKEPEKKYVLSEPAVNDTNATNETKKLTISGKLVLQESTDLCPHLLETFDCNKYDVRRCKFKTTVGQNDFFPDYMICRSGYEYKNENPNHKYCFVQECRPLEKNNIVEAYGGPVMYAEYSYSVENIPSGTDPGGINTHYTLFRCGEEYKEFSTSHACSMYSAQVKKI